jgi:excisionase family DNA binding protein
MTALERGVAAASPPAGDWLTIHEASQLVGVSVATLRRWCDAGEVRCFTTPGGHRRFDRVAVLGLVPAPSMRRPSVACGGETAIRIVRAYRRDVRRGAESPALDAVPEGARQHFREHGRAMVAALVELLDQPVATTSGALARAERSAAVCGRAAAESGMSLQEVIELFLRFRTPFLHEIGAMARRWRLDAAAATALLQDAADGVDGLLPAMVAGFEQG